MPAMGWRELTIDLLLLLLLVASHLEAVSFPEDNIPLDVVDRHCKNQTLFLNCPHLHKIFIKKTFGTAGFL